MFRFRHNWEYRLPHWLLEGLIALAWAGGSVGWRGLCLGVCEDYLARRAGGGSIRCVLGEHGGVKRWR